VRIAMVEALVAGDSLRRTSDRLSNRCDRGQRGEGCAGGVNKCPEIATVLAMGMMGVVVTVRLSASDSDDQCLVQAIPIGDRVAVGLLGEKIDVVANRLAGHQRL